MRDYCNVPFSCMSRSIDTMQSWHRLGLEYYPFLFVAHYHPVNHRDKSKGPIFKLTGDCLVDFFYIGRGGHVDDYYVKIDCLLFHITKIEKL